MQFPVALRKGRVLNRGLKVKELVENIFTRKPSAAWEKVDKVLAEKRSRRVKKVSGTCKVEVGVDISKAHKS